MADPVVNTQFVSGTVITADWLNGVNDAVNETFPDDITALEADVAAIEADLLTKAPLASPVFTGNPTAPTPSPGDNDTSIATSAFVTAAITAAQGRLIDFQIFTASGTWTKPTGTNSVIVYVIGGGGGGGGAPATSGTQMSAGAGGGSGGFAFERITSGLGATESVTVGTGGAGAAGSSGATGNPSSFGAHCTGNGGAGGTSAGPATNSFFILGSAGGGASGGNLNFPGGAGSPGMAEATNTTAVGGSGGMSFFSGGGSNVSANNNGTAGIANTGGGGGGAANGLSQAARAGGAGGSGVVMVYSYA